MPTSRPSPWQRPAPPAPRRALRRRPRERGVATLVIVMLLFFVVALTAAYAARNLVFEQRTAANQLRSTQAFEAAEAGAEWALALLNAGRIDDACRPVGGAGSGPLPNPPPPSFRERYLSVSAADGMVGVRSRSDGGVLGAGCVLDASGASPVWRCSCPSDGLPALAAPGAVGAGPAFRVRFAAVPTRPGVVRIDVNGCTRLDEACLAFPSQAVDGDSRVRVAVLAALKSGLVTPPSAAVTVQGRLGGAATLEAYNPDAASGGLALHAGAGADGPPAVLAGPAGTPADLAQLLADPAMAALPPERMFISAHGMWRRTWAEQPATLHVDCRGACTRAALAEAARLNPGRMLWVAGDVVLDTSGDIGARDAPALLVVDGNLSTQPGAQVRLYGLLHFVNANGAAGWSVGGRLSVVGGLVSEGDWTLAGPGRTVVAYDAAILRQLRLSHGSFVRVPGSWRDFERTIGELQ